MFVRAFGRKTEDGEFMRCEKQQKEVKVIWEWNFGYVTHNVRTIGKVIKNVCSNVKSRSVRCGEGE